MSRITFIFLLFVLTPNNSQAQTDTIAVKTIKGITDKMLELISGDINEERHWEEYRNLFLPTAHKTSLRPSAKPGRQLRTQNVEEFIRNVGPLFKKDGFKEVSIGLTINEYNGIATAFQSFHAKNLLGTYSKKGINCYQLVYADNRWWIVSTVFVNENPDNPIPEKYLDASLPDLDNTETSWRKLPTEIYGGKQDDIDFVDQYTGWYINGYGRIYHTKDGGQTWTKQWEKKGTFFRTIAFINKQVGFVGTVGTDYYPNVTDSIPLYKTIDGGQTWLPVSYSGPYVKGLCAIDIVEESTTKKTTNKQYHIYGVGRVGSPANILISHDGGTTWNAKSMKQHCSMLLDIKMQNKKTGFVAASSEEGNALILKTTDGGNTWNKVYQSTRPYENIWKLSFPSEQVGYGTIQSNNRDPRATQQRIVKTTDGGNTWKEMNLINDPKAREFGIGFIDENHGFVGTVNSGYETKDGGKNWTPIDMGTACNKIKIYNNNKGKIYGFGIGVDVLKLMMF